MKKYIVLAMLGVGGFMLFGFITLAIARMKEAENQAGCRNNVKQNTLAIIKTADESAGLMPRASYPHPTEPPSRRLSWMVAILPQVESATPYHLFDRLQPWDSEQNLPLSKIQFLSFVCPVVRGQSAAAAGVGPITFQPSAFFKTSYVGISGVGQNASLLPLNDPRCGAFGHDRQARYPKDFTDGTSQTLLIVETADRNGPWAAGDVPTLRYIDPDTTPQIGRDAPFGRSHSPGWYWRPSPDALHANAGLADGSVRHLSSSISPQVLAAAATIAGDDILDCDW